MSKLEQVHAFIQVAEKQSFIGAAKNLAVSNAAISRQITRLEKTLKTQLLQRSTRQVKLTDIGQQYYEACKQALANLDEAEALIAQNLRVPSGKLKVMVSRYFAEHTILKYLPEFIAKYPKIIIELELAERFPDISQEGIDILFGVVAFPESLDLVRKEVCQAHYILCASPPYLHKHGTPKVPEDLASHQFIAHSRRRNPDQVEFIDHPTVYVKPTLWLNDTYAMQLCAQHGLGITRVLNIIAQEAVQEEKLVEILANYRSAAQPLYLYYQPRRYLQPKIRHFIDFYTQKLQNYCIK